MMKKVADGRRLYFTGEATTPQWMRLLLAGGLGAIIAVFAGWVDTHGESIKVFLALVGVIVASTTAFVGGRTITEAADRRDTRRLINAALARLEDLENMLGIVDTEVERFRDATKSRPATKNEILAVASAIQATAVLMQQPADLSGFLDDDADRLHARTTSIIQTIFRMEDLTSLWGESDQARQKSVERFTDLYAQRPGVNRKAISNALAHFKAKLTNL